MFISKPRYRVTILFFFSLIHLTGSVRKRTRRQTETDLAPAGSLSPHGCKGWGWYKPESGAFPLCWSATGRTGPSHPALLSQTHQQGLDRKESSQGSLCSSPCCLVTLPHGAGPSSVFTEVKHFFFFIEPDEWIPRCI